MKILYFAYIKSHCDYPDFEAELEARSFNEACYKLAQVVKQSPEEIGKYVVAQETLANSFDCSACNEYQKAGVADGCPLHAWQKETPQSPKGVNIL